MQKGKLIVIYGCMFAGKTTKLIDTVNSLLEAGKKVAIFHPVIDTRYKLNAIASHDGDSLISRAIALKVAHIPIDGFDTAIIDELHFFGEDIIGAVQELLAAGVDVYVAGLDKSYLGEPFATMQKLISTADEKIELFAKCAVCGKPAMYTYRTVKNDDLLVVGGADMYEARCDEHFKEGMGNR